MDINKKFEEIVYQYEKLIYTICYNLLKNKEEAENMAQETFLNLYKSFERYKDLPENELKNLICKIAINKCKDYFKVKINNLQDQMANIDEEINLKSDENIEEKLLKEEEKKNINKIINEMKSPYKEVLIEYYIKEKSLDEVALKLEVNKSTLKMQIHRAKKILKEKILEERKE